MYVSRIQEGKYEKPGAVPQVLIVTRKIILINLTQVRLNEHLHETMTEELPKGPKVQHTELNKRKTKLGMTPVPEVSPLTLT